MPLSAAATRTAMAAEPTSGGANPTTVTVELTFDGVTFNPVALYDALDVAYGTVAADTDAVGHNQYRLRITP